MAKGINTSIIEAKSRFVGLINELQLPIAITQMIMQDIMVAVGKEVENAVEQERQAELQDENKQQLSEE